MEKQIDHLVERAKEIQEYSDSQKSMALPGLLAEILDLENIYEKEV